MIRLSVLIVVLFLGGFMNLHSAKPIEMKLWQDGAPAGVVPDKKEMMKDLF